MKPTTIILVSILTLGAGCGPPGGRLPVGSLIQLEQRSDGLTYKEGDTQPYTGQLTITVAGTNEKYVTHFQDGVRHGLLAVWYANGKRKANAEFTRGKLVSGITWKPKFWTPYRFHFKSLRQYLGEPKKPSLTGPNHHRTRLLAVK